MKVPPNGCSVILKSDRQFQIYVNNCQAKSRRVIDRSIFVVHFIHDFLCSITPLAEVLVT